MVRFTEWFKRLSSKLFSRKKEFDKNANAPEEWREILKDYKYTYWNEELQQPVALAIKPGSREEYLRNHPEEVRRILIEHGVDPDDDSMLGVINIGKKEDKPKEENP